MLVGWIPASNVMAGHETTCLIYPGQMIYHAFSSSSCPLSVHLVVVDLPFGSYQGNSKELLACHPYHGKESGAHAVKMEGGREIKESVERQFFLPGVPVMGHLESHSQSIYKFGTYVVRARERRRS